MLKLTTAAAVLALASLPMTALAAASTDGAFQVANVAPPEEPETPPAAAPAETPAADPAAPPTAETPTAPDAPSSTEPPEVMEGTTPPVEAAPEAAPPADAAETPAAEASSGGMGMGTIIGVIAFLAVAAGAGYWFMNRKA